MNNELTDLLVEGFHKLDSRLLDNKAPKLTFLPGFYDKADPAKLKYLVRLASTMNHAAKLVSVERDNLVKLMVKKEMQLGKMAANVKANEMALQSEVTRMNAKQQGFHAEVRRLNARIRELERGDID